MNKIHKFRAWYKPDFETEDGPLKFVQKDIKGELFFVMEKVKSIKYRFEIPFLDEDWVIQRFTGFKSNKNKEIYEGDIISFEYTVGDQAWEWMSKEEYAQNTEMNGKRLKGLIKNEIGDGTNLIIIVGDDKSTHMMFPLAYARKSIILGNIFESI